MAIKGTHVAPEMTILCSSRSIGAAVDGFLDHCRACALKRKCCPNMPSRRIVAI